ncbi:MAG TPA: hypothetical protein VFE42_22525 [Chloroflexota bacterium]|nr:hypothetical protein [Chloroflexota bacterium]
MRVLALANLDGQAPPRAALQTVARAAGVAAIVFVGDVLPPRDGLIADDADRYDAFFGALAALGLPVAIIPGERDRPGGLLRQVAETYASRTRPFAVVDRTVLPLTPRLIVGGLGGLLPDGPAHEDVPSEIYAALAPLRCHAGALLLAHTPPRGRIVSRDGGQQVGRWVVNALIEALGVRLVVCGHAQDGQGQENIGPALVVNPGPLSAGRYAIIDPHRRSVCFGVLPRYPEGRTTSAPARRRGGWRETTYRHAHLLQSSGSTAPRPGAVATAAW